MGRIINKKVKKSKKRKQKDENGETSISGETPISSDKATTGLTWKNNGWSNEEFAGIAENYTKAEHPCTLFRSTIDSIPKESTVINNTVNVDPPVLIKPTKYVMHEIKTITKDFPDFLCVDYSKSPADHPGNCQSIWADNDDEVGDAGEDGDIDLPEEPFDVVDSIIRKHPFPVRHKSVPMGVKMPKRQIKIKQDSNQELSVDDIEF